MLENLQQKIQQHFSQPEIQKKFRQIVDKYLTDAKVKDIFLSIFEQIKTGDFDILDLDRYLVEDIGLSKEMAFKFNDELFKEVYIGVYFELLDLYEQKVKQKLGMRKKLPGKEEFEKKLKGIQSRPETRPPAVDLTKVYSRFVASSLFQNILAAQEQMKEKYGDQIGLKKSYLAPGRSLAPTDEPGADKEDDIKNEFYAAINAGDKIKTLGILRLLAEYGKLRDFFHNDKRYIDFFSGVLARHQGEEQKAEFLRDPANKKYLADFLKFILEKRLGFSVEESAMLGAGLGSLCREAGEHEYGDLAYGDEKKNRFTWSV